MRTFGAAGRKCVLCGIDLPTECLAESPTSRSVWFFRSMGVDCDNGSEFLNHHLRKYLAHRKRPVKFTRSRPYHKNDPAHVEQKQLDARSSFLGYDRLGDLRMIEPINALYDRPWSQLHHFFCPSMKLVSKERVGAKYRKKYDPPQSPYQRLMASELLS